MDNDVSPETPDSKGLIEIAMELADNGVPVFPVGKNKTPVWPKGKSPNGRDGFHMATTDADEVEALFCHSHARGIGMPTGKISGVTVIDVDCGQGKPNRIEATMWLEANRKALWGSTVVRTGSGGLHYWCRYTEGLTNRANTWAKGVDCRNDGGYVVIPPFMGYRFERQTEPDDWPAPPPVPPEMMKAVKQADDGSGRTPEHILALRDLISSKTTWHDPVRDIVAHLVGSGWSDAEILRFTFQWTWDGYQPRETFEELCVMINGARQKWDRERGPKDTNEARLWKLAEIWNGSPPSVRQEFFNMIREAGNDG